ncbi:redox-sensing transcriptional repressor [Allostreptomyces psammosilenae]|uniref:Redox-sensing transcriptional repressor Rex n=1 Tax=Allostreptomyces psammosilenae TaxID=1892865 RepID=A0A853A5J2_9ACTN|nr:redox-sensing transcriptional repressor Rex [Allostreptomyces psammosilenae]NYI05762.1 redox-sensing transcriptional repressor [Allostreptomyces psammosilenae]
MASGRTHRSANRSRGIPEATVARLPLYLRALIALSERSVPTVSSEELASATGVNSAKLRKDFSYLGSYGTRGVGYDVEYLVYQISRELGLTQSWPVVIVGIGNLGHALANYGGIASRGFRVAALIDADPAVVGTVVANLTVQHADDLESIVRDNGVSIGVIATPATVAQKVCDRLVAAGVTSILNFAPTVLTVPEGVDVRKVDLSIELQILAFHEQRKAAESLQAAQDAGAETAEHTAGGTTRSTAGRRRRTVVGAGRADGVARAEREAASVPTRRGGVRRRKKHEETDDGAVPVTAPAAERGAVVPADGTEGGTSKVMPA